MIDHVIVRDGSSTDGIASVAIDTDILVDFHLSKLSKWEKIAKHKSGMSYYPVDMTDDPVQCARDLYKVLTQTSAKRIGVCGAGTVEIAHSSLTELDLHMSLKTIFKLLKEHGPKDLELWVTGAPGVECITMACAFGLQIPLKLVTDEQCTGIDDQGLEVPRSPAQIFQSFELFI